MIADLVFLVLAGSLWHFVHELSGRTWIVGLIAPINESVWEHLKLAHGATILLLLVDLWRRRRGVPISILGRALGIIVAGVIIVIGFYAYTSVVGQSILMVDIALYVGGCFAAAWLHARIVQFRPGIAHTILGLILLTMLMLLFAKLTYDPPAFGMFDRPPSRINAPTTR